jgi:hypothetical protein
VLSADRREAALTDAQRHVSEASYGPGLRATEPHAYLQTLLADTPSRFASVFNIT